MHADSFMLSLLVMCVCSNTYSALNALAGHYNSFGATAPIPKKRLERLSKVRLSCHPATIVPFFYADAAC